MLESLETAQYRADLCIHLERGEKRKGGKGERKRREKREKKEGVGRGVEGGPGS